MSGKLHPSPLRSPPKPKLTAEFLYACFCHELRCIIDGERGGGSAYSNNASVIRIDRCGYSTSTPVSTWMGDRLRTGKSSRYLGL